MTRLVAFLVLAAALAALAALVTMEHRPSGYAMPLLIDAEAAQQPPAMLFAPCPLSPKNLPLPIERKA